MRPEITINKHTQQLTVRIPETTVTVDIITGNSEETAQRAINIMLNRIVQQNRSEFVLKSDIKHMKDAIKYLQKENESLKEMLNERFV